MNRSGKTILASMIVLLLLMLFTQPAKLPAPVLVVPFALIAAILVASFIAAFRWQGMSLAKSVRLGVIGASLPMLVLVLQAFGQLTIRDLGTILAIFAIAYFYLSRITKPSSE